MNPLPAGTAAITDASEQEILKARARALARPAEEVRSTGDSLEIIEFRLAHERYAVEQAYAIEIHPFEMFTPLPCVPAHFLGIVNLRGQILPVMDIKKFFDLPESGITDLHVIVVVRVEEIEIGILADLISGVRCVARSEVQPSLPTLTGIRSQYLKGVTADRVVILDACKILKDPQLIVNEEVRI